jgi:hypothetical protein
MPVFKDLTGERFNSLTLTKYLGRSKWLCKCDCGNEVAAGITDIKTGKQKSCGCHKARLAADRHRIHGLGFTPEYMIWKGIKSRCFNKNEAAYKHYGGRGITICDAWKDDPVAFINYVGKRPSEAHSIDRINNDGNYEPGNVRWATPKEQANNQRPRSTLHLITAFGETHSVTEWSRRTGVNRKSILRRVNQGWSPEDTVSKPTQSKRKAA